MNHNLHADLLEGLYGRLARNYWRNEYYRAFIVEALTQVLSNGAPIR